MGRRLRSFFRRPARLAAALALTVLALLGAVCVGLRVYYNEFYSTAQAAFPLPGLEENFVPQGVESCGGGEFLLSGYVSSDGTARLYYISAGGSAQRILLYDRDGAPLVSHAGGVCTNGPFTYLAGGGGTCHVLSSAELFDPTSREATVLGEFQTDNAASFCCLWGDHLIVGEYEYGRFQTDGSHHLTTPAGDWNTAVMLSYPLDGDQPYGVDQEPDAAWSIPERVQGMCIAGDGRVILSASSFRNSSQLFFYDQETAVRGPHGIFWTGGRAVPIFYLDTGSCVDVVHLPPYSEEAVCVGGQLYIVFESAANRFRVGRLLGGQNVYRMPLP